MQFSFQFLALIALALSVVEAQTTISSYYASRLSSINSVLSTGGTPIVTVPTSRRISGNVTSRLGTGTGTGIFVSPTQPVNSTALSTGIPTSPVKPSPIISEAKALKASIALTALLGPIALLMAL